ncbi:MAG: 3-hydroxyacyl-CoA dehydrogenase family protein [Eubacteriales bacterium]
MNIKTVTVIGANGTMGCNVSGIFASFGDAKVYMVSRDIEKSKKAALKAVKSVKAESIKQYLIPVDYSMLAQCIRESDLVFESVAENLETKLDITKMIAASLQDDTIVCSGTSGLSLTTLAEVFPENLRMNYFGIHMFNPPYNMTLCEVTPTKYTNLELFENIKIYLSDILFRTVVEVKDSPAFLGNRIGFQFINEALQYAEKYKYSGGIDYIDAILGPFTGRSMAPLTTSDFVGLDVHKAIVDNIYTNTKDYAHETFILPTFTQKLISEGKLGRKTNGGLYKMDVYGENLKRLTVYDITTGTYRDKMRYSFPFVEQIIYDLQIGDYSSAFKTLIENRSAEADICLEFLLKYVIYSLVATSIVGYNIHAADDVMAAGFNWCPPLAMIKALSSVADFKTLVKERLDNSIIDVIDIDNLLADIEPSKYDYRLYFKSVR